MATEQEKTFARGMGFITPVGDDLISQGDDAITNNAAIAAREIERARFFRGAMGGPTHAVKHADDAPTGMVVVTAGGHATSAGLPVPYTGTVETYAGNSFRVQTFRSTEPSVWMRRRGSAGWTEWVRTDAIDMTPWFAGVLGGAPNHVAAHADNAPHGVTIVTAGPTAIEVGLPVAATGTVETYAGNSFRVQTFRSTEPSVWMRRRGSAGWTDWVRIDAIGARETSLSAGSGFKRVPLALSLGLGSAPTTWASGAARIPVDFNAPITRWRLHIANVNPRFGNALPGTHEIGGVWIGDHLGDGDATELSQIAEGGTVAGVEEYVTPWISEQIGTGAERLVTFSWTGSEPVVSLVGGCWRSPNPEHASQAAPGLTQANRVPFFVWIEAETYAQTPVVATSGSSTSIGVGADVPVHGSAISILGRERGFLPVHYAHSGDTISASLDPGHYKWQVWSDLDRPDAVLNQMGSNDVFGVGADLTQMQALHTDWFEFLAAHVSPVIYDTTLFPRTTVTGSAEVVRQAFNAWLEGMPGGSRALFDFNSAVSADDETLRPEMDYDGTHVNDLGHAALSAAVDQVISSPPVLYAQEA